MAYDSIVAVVDLSSDAKTILAKAICLLKTDEGQLYLVHVIEPLSISTGYDLMPDLPPEWEVLLQQRAEDFLKKLVEECGQGNIQTTVRLGSVKKEIFSHVKDKQADLIVVGTHGRHGIGLLLGSTATAVLHGTPCDVLAVRLEEGND